MARRNSAALIVIVSLTAGCTSPLTVPIEVATTMAEERKVGDVGNDARIKASILSQFTEEAKGLLMDVGTDVYEGQVMLTGSVKRAEDRAKAEELVRQVNGVREIFNEIQVTQEGGVLASANDTRIELSLKANLFTTRGISSINYRWRAVNGVVYLIGTAQDQDELDRVFEVIRATSGVRDIVSHVRVKLQQEAAR